jgi:hypothetical protein
VNTDDKDTEAPGTRERLLGLSSLREQGVTAKAGSQLLGLSPWTVRRTLDNLVLEGEVEVIGTVSTHPDGSGHKARVYRLVRPPARLVGVGHPRTPTPPDPPTLTTPRGQPARQERSPEALALVAQGQELLEPMSRVLLGRRLTTDEAELALLRAGLEHMKQREVKS